MAITHNLGFPRIGKHRELKFALEKYWKGDASAENLQQHAAAIRQQNWQHQEAIDWVPVGDFSLYDQVLDMSFLLGHVPERVAYSQAPELDKYFQLARGRSSNQCQCTQAGELTKWFDTNYHYIVPEISAQTRFQLQPKRLLAEIAEAQTSGVNAKPVLIGPVTYLWLSKTKDNTQPLDLLEPLLVVYNQLLDALKKSGVEWLQIDEPILVTELSAPWKHALEKAYHSLKSSPLKILLTTYFGTLEDNLQLACNLPCAGLHLDATRARAEVNKVIDWLPAHKVLSLGVIDGRNIWKTDLTKTLDWLEPIAERLQNRLWLAPSCSLLHVPVDLTTEQEFEPEIQTWVAFAVQKITELTLLKTAINSGRESVAQALSANHQAQQSRRQSPRVHNLAVRNKVQNISAAQSQRQSPFRERSLLQSQHLPLPAFPTTTIGSFPQTKSIRQLRAQFKSGAIDSGTYQKKIQTEIHYCIRKQEELELDVLVHGEAERNDMVEYFGEQLEGYVFSRYGWVQSYGSRCVKPPIIFGDIHRPKAMTVDCTTYAQSLTQKPVKGMLTGPVTLLNWSFVRDDQDRKLTCYQLALAIREETLDLEDAGVKIIQIDEAALREGLPLRQSEWQQYLEWAVESFRLCANGVQDSTQIHTHMCYSNFNDIIEAIAAMDADVITIETSRSNGELLDAFKFFHYPNAIGPGVYDIHSPNTPNVNDMVKIIRNAAAHLPEKQLWINPDCGLKTRQWEDVMPALTNMVSAAKELRKKHAGQTAELKPASMVSA